MKNPIRVEPAQVRPLIETAAEAGVDVGPILAKTGLARADIEGQGRDGVRLSDYYRLQHHISNAVEDETFHLSSRQLLPGTTDFVLAHLDGATSLHEAIKIVARHYNLLHGGEYNLVRRRGDVVTLVIDDRKFPYTLKDNPEYIRFTIECVMIFVHCMMATIAPRRALDGLRGVAVTREKGGREAPHLSFWSAPVRYGSATYALDYDAGIAAERLSLPPAPMRTRERVYDQIIDMVDAKDGADVSSGAMSRLVRDSLANGVIDQRRIAAMADVSIATLRRRLGEEGTSFRELRREVLNEAAKALLRKKRPIADVADELGFSEFRSFNRAFKEWNGVTPKAYLDGLTREKTL